MQETIHQPGPYTLGHLGRNVMLHAPAVIRGAADLVAGFGGAAAIPAAARVGAQLRAAKLLGCPACRALFPRLAGRSGLSEAEVAAAVGGELAALPAEVAAAVAWTEAIIAADGDTPLATPEAALALTAGQRDHLVVWTRLDMIIHSVGLMFLPHSMIERAFED